MRTFVSVVLVFLATTPLAAQNPGVEYERVLIPVLLETPLPGARGSLWSINLWLTNNSDRAVDIYPYYWGCQLETCPSNPPTPPRVSFRPMLSATPELPGIFMFVERSKALDVEFSLRVQDLSRQSQIWGTEIPVIRESEFRAGRIDLLDITISPEFRYMLRLYDPNPLPGGSARIRVFAVNPELRNPLNGVPDALVGETVLSLTMSGSGKPSLYPGYAQLSDFSSFSLLSGVARVRVEIEPVLPTTRLWAFISITNNETQHVTTITPQ